MLEHVLIHLDAHWVYSIPYGHDLAERNDDERFNVDGYHYNEWSGYKVSL